MEAEKKKYNNLTLVSDKDREIWLEGNCFWLCRVTALNSYFPVFTGSKHVYDYFSCIPHEFLEDICLFL